MLICCVNVLQQEAKGNRAGERGEPVSSH